MKTLILYISREGQTRAIAFYLAKQLQESCDVLDLLQIGDIDLTQYQQVLIGASIRYGHFHPKLQKFVQQHATQLNRISSGFFSVSLVARKPEKSTPQTNAYTRKFLQTSPWQPKHCAVFAGALRYPRYRWFDKLIIQLIMRLSGGETDSSKEKEYTDWQQVAHFAQVVSQMDTNASNTLDE